MSSIVAPVRVRGRLIPASYRRATVRKVKPEIPEVQGGYVAVERAR
jgi:hypothetical protein